MSNYPPGVTGNEWQIAGPPDLLWLDGNGEELDIGDVISTNTAETEDDYRWGQVVEFEPPEGDVDEDGHSVHTPALIIVQWADGSRENFSCVYQGGYGEDQFTCEEIIKSC